MEKKQEMEWHEAQKIAISEDLVAAAKQQLQFLAEVDRFRQLYNGPALDRAIYRYKYCWLPLLAKHENSKVSESPLVVPLDCEWIWHCHRLNPVQYKNDCVELYGRILGNKNVLSSTQATSKKQTEEIWNRMYPNETYELNMNTQISKDSVLGAQNSSKYDLVSAVKRQSSFYFQVSRSYMKDDVFLEEAVARYKGFLHLIKRNQERSIRQFCVPTFDIDLIWHSHQLHAVSYWKDLMAVLGRVLQHDDTDSDRSKGSKMDTGFSRTTKLWEDTFGSRYWKAGAMNRGSAAPSPLTINMNKVDNLSKKVVDYNKYQSMIQNSKKMCVEAIMLEIVEVRNLPAGHKGDLFVTFNKKQPDMFFYGKRRLSISSEAGEKQVAVFQCEPIGELVLELLSYSPSLLHLARLGTISISLQDLMKPGSPLSVEKWFELMPNSGTLDSHPINMRISLSFTPPVQAPFMLQLVKKNPISTSFFSLPPGRFQHNNSWSCIVDDAGNEIVYLQMRDSTKVEAKDSYYSKKEVIGITASGETHVLAEFAGTGWSLMNSSWWFQLQNKLNKVGHVFELTGDGKVIIFPGKQMEYGIAICEKHRSEQNWMTAVEFSAEYPCGKAVALFDLKSGFLKINEEWLVFPGILLAFLLSNTLVKTDYCREVEEGLEMEFEKITGGIEVNKYSKSNKECGNETEATMNCTECLIQAGSWSSFCVVGDIVKRWGCGGGACGGPSCKCSSCSQCGSCGNN